MWQQLRWQGLEAATGQAWSRVCPVHAAGCSKVGQALCVIGASTALQLGVCGGAVTEFAAAASGQQQQRVRCFRACRSWFNPGRQCHLCVARLCLRVTFSPPEWWLAVSWFWWCAVVVCCLLTVCYTDQAHHPTRCIALSPLVGEAAAGPMHAVACCPQVVCWCRASVLCRWGYDPVCQLLWCCMVTLYSCQHWQRAADCFGLAVFGHDTGRKVCPAHVCERI
jgi:hypothetical protein